MQKNAINILVKNKIVIESILNSNKLLYNIGINPNEIDDIKCNNILL